MENYIYMTSYTDYCKLKKIIKNCNSTRVSIKNKQNYFCYNVKLPPNVIIFGTKIANSVKLHEMHSFSTSSNSCQCTTVLNADAPNCYIILDCLLSLCQKLSDLVEV